MFRKCVTVALVAVTLLASGLYAKEEREAAMDVMGGKETKQGKVCRNMGWSGGDNAAYGKIN